MRCCPAEQRRIPATAAPYSNLSMKSLKAWASVRINLSTAATVASTWANCSWTSARPWSATAPRWQHDHRGIAPHLCCGKASTWQRGTRQTEPRHAHKRVLHVAPLHDPPAFHDGRRNPSPYPTAPLPYVQDQRRG